MLSFSADSKSSDYAEDDLMHSELPVATDHEDNTCMDEEIDDGEVWDMNIYDIDDDIQECTTKASGNRHYQYE